MTSIPVAIRRFSDNNFKSPYLKKQCFFSLFYCISEICTKFTTFWKKREYPSLIITKIIASEGDAYLNV